MKKRTAKTLDQVRAWIEATPHHIGDWSEGTHCLLKGHHEQLRVPIDIWNRCHVIPGGRLDARMFRWDFNTEKEWLFLPAEERAEREWQRYAQSRGWALQASGRFVHMNEAGEVQDIVELPELTWTALANHMTWQAFW